MAVYTVFAQPELRRYKVNFVSWATIIACVCVILTWIPPWTIVYQSQTFWPTVSGYHEKPNVNFKKQLLISLATSNATTGSHVTWSTYPNFNALESNSLRHPSVKSREVDYNGDGLNDRLLFELRMPLADTEQVYGVKLVLIFDYLLTKYSTFQMESMAYITHFSPVAGAGLQMMGELRLVADNPLQSVGTDATYNYSVINGSGIFAEDYALGRILNQYSSRQVTTYLGQKYPVWVSGRGAGEPFVVNVTINYPEVYDIPYYVDFWQRAKEGWILYLSVLVVFWFLFRSIKIFIFSNQVVTTTVERPFKTYR